MSSDISPLSNQLLASLPKSELEVLSPYLEEVPLTLGEVLLPSREPIESVYFPSRAVISLVYTLEDGSTAEIGVVGNEGMVGIPVFLGGRFSVSSAVVQVSGNGFRLDAEALKAEFDRGGSLQKKLLLYTQALLTQVSQSAVCKSHHKIETRLARWLLLVQDRMQSAELSLTQKFISQMLGTRRASVTDAASLLSREGIITYNRGQITILDRQALEKTACECYQVVRSECLRLLGNEDGENGN